MAPATSTASENDHFRPAHRCNDDVRRADYIREISGAAMGDRHGAAFLKQKAGHGFSNDVGAAHHHCVEAGERAAEGALQEDEAAGRGAGYQSAVQLTGRQQADIDRMEAVNILLRADQPQHLAFIDMVRQRQLHQNAMNVGVIVELVDKREHIGFAGIGRKRVFYRMKAASLRRPVLVANVDLTRGVFPNEDDRQTGAFTAGFQQFGCPVGDFLPDTFRDSLAIDDLSLGHSASSLVARLLKPATSYRGLSRNEKDRMRLFLLWFRHVCC